jgi:magnesium chelatase family protein
MLAERLPGLLPDLTSAESLEVSAVHSVAGMLSSRTPLLHRPVFVDPHHTASVASIVGGGSRVIRPGAMSLAHRGVLFMDEAPEFAAHVLEALRQPLESGQVTISRADASATYPARFLLILAANPCPCGQAPSPECTCTPTVMRRYRDRISGPVRDRIDIFREVMPVPRHELLDALSVAESSDRVANRVREARARQQHRYADTPWRLNTDVPTPELRARWPMPAQAVRRLDEPVTRGALSARGLDRVARLAWTVADLAGHAAPTADDVEAAWGLRHSSAVPLHRAAAGRRSSPEQVPA